MSDTSALYEPLIERDLAAIPAAARAFAARNSVGDLWIAVTRFAVLAYAPSQHAKRAVLACRAAHEVRDEVRDDVSDRWLDLIVECALYTAESRQPWSEPPILEMPAVDPAAPRDLDELRAAIAANDRERAERWLAARIDDAYEDLRAVAKGDALLMLDAAIALEPLLGEKGRYALLRIVILELLTESDDDVPEPLEVLIDRAIAERGSVDAVRNVFIAAANRSAPEPRRGGIVVAPRVSVGDGRALSFEPHRGDTSSVQPSVPPLRGSPGEALVIPNADALGYKDVAPTGLGATASTQVPLSPYPLARDYAQTLIAHAIARTLPARADEFLAAVHHNLEHGESFAAWSFA